MVDPSARSYVNLPLPLAAAIEIEPGEMVKWKIDTRYKLWLTRQQHKNGRGFFSRIRLLCVNEPRTSLSLLGYSPVNLVQPYLLISPPTHAFPPNHL
jgi:hypothetical protein